MRNDTLVLATDRLAVFALLSHIQDVGHQQFTLTRLPLAGEAFAEHSEVTRSPS